MSLTLSCCQQSVIAGLQCPHCGGPGSPAGERDGYPLRQCDCRGAVLLSFPWSDEAEYHAWYACSGAYHDTEQQANGQSPSPGRDTEHLTASLTRLQALAALGASSGRLLDVGAGVGSFVAAATARGYQASGLEPNLDMVRLARSLGRNVHAGDWGCATGPFDIITLHDVFEHLTRPWECLDHLRGVLIPSGMLVIEMPEYACSASIQAGPGWKHVRPRQHICLYSERAARNLFTAAGWELEALIRPCRGRVGKATYYLSRSSEAPAC